MVVKYEAEGMRIFFDLISLPTKTKWYVADMYTTREPALNAGSLFFIIDNGT